MKKVEYEENIYFIDDDKVYMEIENVKEFIDKDNIKKYLIDIDCFSLEEIEELIACNQAKGDK